MERSAFTPCVHSAIELSVGQEITVEATVRVATIGHAVTVTSLWIAGITCPDVAFASDIEASHRWRPVTSRDPERVRQNAKRMRCVPSQFLPEDGIVSVGQNNVRIQSPGLVQGFRRHGVAACCDQAGSLRKSTGALVRPAAACQRLGSWTTAGLRQSSLSRQGIGSRSSRSTAGWCRRPHPPMVPTTGAAHRRRTPACACRRE